MDWSYIAGYFDGEGHVQLLKKQRSNGLTWYNQHRESLEAMQHFMGCGRVPACMGGKNRDVSVLTVRRRADILRVGAEMLPHLIIKKDKVAELIEWINATRNLSRENRLSLPKEPEVIRALYERGLSTAGIGNLFQVHHSAVVLYMRKHGLGRRDSGGKALLGVPKSFETRERMRAARQQMWADPAFRASQLASLRAGRIAHGQIKQTGA